MCILYLPWSWCCRQNCKYHPAANYLSIVKGFCSFRAEQKLITLRQVHKWEGQNSSTPVGRQTPKLHQCQPHFQRWSQSEPEAVRREDLWGEQCQPTKDWLGWLWKNTKNRSKFWYLFTWICLFVELGRPGHTEIDDKDSEMSTKENPTLSQCYVGFIKTH